MKKISVIVPVYNVEKYLCKCISSILNQTFKDFELILINDGSEDNSGMICDQFKEKDNRIKVVHKQNEGISSARNQGINLSRCEYITFVDSDDYIHPQLLETLFHNLEENKAEISICNNYVVYEDSKIQEAYCENNVTLYNGREMVKKILDKGDLKMIVPWMKLYKRDLFDGIKYPLNKYHEDEFVTYRLLYNCNRVAYTDDKLYYYLKRENSITGSKYCVKRLAKLEALEEAILYYENKNDVSFTTLAYYRYLFNTSIAYYRVKYEMEDNTEILNSLISKYNAKYKEFNIRKVNEISIFKGLILKLFYYFPNVYCFFVRTPIFIISKIKGNNL